MERYFSTGQNPQRAVAPTEEEKEEIVLLGLHVTRGFRIYVDCLVYINIYI